MKKPKPKRKTSFFPSLSSTFFFFFARHENQHALLNNSVPSCQERRAAEVKLSARQERIKKGRLQAGVQDDNLSLRGVWRRSCRRCEPICQLQLCKSAARCWSVACDRRSLVALSPLHVHTRSHTHISHTHITHLHAKVEAFTCGYAHTCMHTYSHSHPHTHTHFPPSSHLQMCSSTGSSRPSFLALGGPMCPTFRLQSLGQ